MEQAQYHALVKSLEVDATIHHGAFRKKVILISGAAYVALFGLLAAMALMFYLGLSYFQTRHNTFSLIRIGIFAVFMLPVFWVVLRMFFMRLPAPEGRFLKRDEAPKLFSVLDRIQKTLKGPKIHHVVIDDEFNAAMFQRPRWGLFGGHTNYLILGLPYLLSSTPKEMLAVVAHEYGHLCGNHGKVTAWVYRQRRTFGALQRQVASSAEDNWVNGIIAGLLEKFAPYYNAHTFVLSRQNEYEADQTSAQLAGAAAAASGLTRGALLAPWIHEEFWPKLYSQADSAARPAFLPFAAMRTAFKAGYAQWATRERLDAAWSQKSGLSDTHPELRDRVEALGEAAAVPACVEVTSAEALLGATSRSIIDEFDRNWWEKEKKEWTSRYQYVTRSKQRLQQLSAQPLTALKLADLQEFAMLSAEFSEPASAKLVLEQLLRQPNGPFPRADYHYGCILLDEGSERGLDHLSAAANADRYLIEASARAGYAYLLKTHGEHRAEQWWDRIVPQDDEEE